MAKSEIELLKPLRMVSMMPLKWSIYKTEKILSSWAQQRFKRQ